MTNRSEDIRYLRKKPKQFRELSNICKTEISEKLREIADDLETRAGALEKRPKVAGCRTHPRDLHRMVANFAD